MQLFTNAVTPLTMLEGVIPLTRVPPVCHAMLEGVTPSPVCHAMLKLDLRPLHHAFTARAHTLSESRRGPELATCVSTVG